jgi:pimeloyl-ACP methyl ester carboxylesterase
VNWAVLAGNVMGRFVSAPLPAALPPGRVVELPNRGSTFVCDVPGPEGAPTLLLLHPLGCTAHLGWYPSIPALTEHYRVVAFDQRWHGRGIRSDCFRLDDCADDAVAVADALGIDRFTVVGYSMGGAVAQLVWRRHRNRVTGLVLGATARNFQGTVKERIWFAFTRLAMARLSGHAYERVLRLAEKLPADPTSEVLDLTAWAMSEFRSTSLWCMASVMNEIGRFNSAPWIGRVDVPSSVLVLTEDRFIPTRRQRRLAEAIPGAVTYEVPGNHAALVLRATEFVPALVAACRSVTRRAAEQVSA